MKIRSREINIFSMSALDLFASAMGAFMLLTVMALPFFPNTGDSPELVAEVAEALADAQAELDAAKDALSSAESALAGAESELADAAQANGDLTEELESVKIPELDIVICLDVSGSMGEAITGMKQQIADLVAVLDLLSPSVGIGVVAFGDRLWDQSLTVQEIVPTTNLPKIAAFIESLETNMGIGSGDNPDTPEDLAAALSQAVVMNWRSVSKRRYIIIISDAPAYPELIDSSFETARAFSAVSSPAQYISTVMVGDNGAEVYLQRLAENGQGEFIDSTSSQSMLASIIMAIVTI